MRIRWRDLAGMLVLAQTYSWVREGLRQNVPSPPPSLPSARPRLSFMVAAWNAAEQIPHFVDAFHSLSYPNKELVLCAGGRDSSYITALRCAGPDVIVVEQKPGDGKQGGLRRAYPSATGDIIYLTDIDCRPNDDAVHNLLAPLLNDSAGAVTGSSRPLERQMANTFVRTQRAVERATEPATYSPSGGILGRNAALKRPVLDAIGAFEVDAPSGTDYTLAKQLKAAGFEIWFVPGHPMPTEYAETLGAYRRQQTRWIRNVYLIGKRYGATGEVVQVLPTLLLPYALLLSLVVGLIKPVFFRLALLMTLHAVLNRLRLQIRAGAEPSPIAGLQHFATTQWAAVHAGIDILKQRVPW